jgi:pimeloyl-ACP methyl ester carboxylesterase
MTEIHPFAVQIPQAILDDLSARLASTRWPDEVAGAGWAYGSNLDYMRELCDYWQNKFDWRTQEKAINRLSHFRTEIEEFGVHFVHEKGKGDNSMPIMLLHGWPSSFLQMQKIIPLLADPETHGGNASDAFDVIVPSLPGYGFSDRPKEKGISVSRIAAFFQELMVDELGYERYALRGSDMGAGVAVQMAIAHPSSLAGLHMSGTNPFIPYIPPDLSPAEQQFIKDAENWRNTEFGYALEQSTRPQTLAYGLNDSPVGLAAWILEKFSRWSDCEGNVENRFSKDELLSNITIYWATETIGSSIRLYYESAHDPTASWGRVEVPTAMAMLPKDMFPTPKEWANRFANIVHWIELPRGGHFAEWEEPQLLAEDIRTFFRPLRD